MRRSGLMGICVAALLAVTPASAEAFTYVVNTTADVAPPGACDPQPGGCTIRDAFTLATGADTIALPAGTFNINPNPGFGELDLTGASVIGAGARSTIIDGGDAT